MIVFIGKRPRNKVSASCGSLPIDEVEILSVQMEKMDVAGKVAMASSDCLEFGAPNTEDSPQSIGDDKRDSRNFSDQVVKQQDIVSISTQEYIGGT